MKVVLVDNFDRDYIADRLLADNLTQEDARALADDFNKKHASYNCPDFAVVKDDNYKLYSPYDLI